MTFSEAKKHAKKTRKGGLIYIEDDTATITGTPLPFKMKKRISKSSKELLAIIENEKIVEGRYYKKDGLIVFSQNIDILGNIYAEIECFGEIKRKENTKTKCYIKIDLTKSEQETLNELKEKYKKT